MKSKDGVGPDSPPPACKGYCKVADFEFPDAYFGWIYECYTLTLGGYRIENNQLSLPEWKDIGMMKSLLENRQDDQRMSSLTTELVGFITALSRRR